MEIVLITISCRLEHAAPMQNYVTLHPVPGLTLQSCFTPFRLLRFYYAQISRIFFNVFRCIGAIKHYRGILSACSVQHCSSRSWGPRLQTLLCIQYEERAQVRHTGYCITTEYIPRCERPVRSCWWDDRSLQFCSPALWGPLHDIRRYTTLFRKHMRYIGLHLLYYSLWDYFVISQWMPCNGPHKRPLTCSTWPRKYHSTYRWLFSGPGYLGI